MPSLDNPAVYKLLTTFKKRYGISQNAVAAALGISAQALTDVKAGRRQFTPKMSEKLLQHYKAEPWAEWLAKALRPDPTTSDPGELSQDDAAEGGMNDFLSSLPPWTVDPTTVPLLRTPCLGAPELSAAYRNERITLPEWAVKLVPADSDPYVLELDTDDYAGMFRMGDRVLVVREIRPTRELAIVERDDCPRLARNAVPTPESKAAAGWIALDSGIPIRGAVPVATIMGIVMAKR